MSGCLVYGVVLICLAFLLLGLVVTLLDSPVREELRTFWIAAGAVGALALGLGIAVAYDWIRKKRACIRLFEDRLEWAWGKGILAIPYAGIRKLGALTYGEMRIEADPGFVVRWDGAHFQAGLGEEFLARVRPYLVARLRAAINRGETVEFREPRGPILAHLVGGFLLVVIAVFWFGMVIQTLVERGFSSGGASFLVLGILILTLAHVALTYYRRAAGSGLSVTHDGLRGPGGSMAWSEVRGFQIDRLGIHILGPAGERVLKLGPTAENYPVALDLLRTYAPGAGTEGA